MLQYGGPRAGKVYPNNGSWNLRHQMLYKPPPEPLRSWVVVCLDQKVKKKNVEDFVKALVPCMEETGGFVVQDAWPPIWMMDGHQSPEEAIAAAVRRRDNTQLVLVVLPGPEAENYNRVKCALERPGGHGIISQCMVSKHLFGKGGGGGRGGGRGGGGGGGSPDPMYLANLVLKVRPVF